MLLQDGNSMVFVGFHFQVCQCCDYFLVQPVLWKITGLLTTHLAEWNEMTDMEGSNLKLTYLWNLTSHSQFDLWFALLNWKYSTPGEISKPLTFHKLGCMKKKEIPCHNILFVGLCTCTFILFSSKACQHCVSLLHFLFSHSVLNSWIKLM